MKRLNKNKITMATVDVMVWGGGGHRALLL